MDTQDFINQLCQFRQHIYASFSQRQDSLMDLLDALCANEGVASVVELSLNPLFRRGYSALYAAIEGLGATREELSPAAAPEGSPPQRRFPSPWVKAIAGVVCPRASGLLVIWSGCDPGCPMSCRDDERP